MIKTLTTNVVKGKYLRNGKPSGKEYTFYVRDDVLVQERTVARAARAASTDAESAPLAADIRYAITCSIPASQEAARQSGVIRKESGGIVMIQRLNEQPTVDAVPVVRCRDCKHMILQSNMKYCTVWHGPNGMGDDGFCNYGERKGGDGNG